MPSPEELARRRLLAAADRRRAQTRRGREPGVSRDLYSPRPPRGRDLEARRALTDFTTDDPRLQYHQQDYINKYQSPEAMQAGRGGGQPWERIGGSQLAEATRKTFAEFAPRIPRPQVVSDVASDVASDIGGRVLGGVGMAEQGAGVALDYLSGMLARYGQGGEGPVLGQGLTTTAASPVVPGAQREAARKALETIPTAQEYAQSFRDILDTTEEYRRQGAKWHEAFSLAITDYHDTRDMPAGYWGAMELISEELAFIIAPHLIGTKLVAGADKLVKLRRAIRLSKAAIPADKINQAAARNPDILKALLHLNKATELGLRVTGKTLRAPMALEDAVGRGILRGLKATVWDAPRGIWNPPDRIQRIKSQVPDETPDEFRGQYGGILDRTPEVADTILDPQYRALYQAALNNISPELRDDLLQVVNDDSLKLQAQLNLSPDRARWLALMLQRGEPAGAVDSAIAGLVPDRPDSPLWIPETTETGVQLPRQLPDDYQISQHDAEVLDGLEVSLKDLADQWSYGLVTEAEVRSYGLNAINRANAGVEDIDLFTSGVWEQRVKEMLGIHDVDVDPNEVIDIEDTYSNYLAGGDVRESLSNTGYQHWRSDHDPYNMAVVQRYLQLKDMEGLTPDEQYRQSSQWIDYEEQQRGELDPKGRPLTTQAQGIERFKLVIPEEWKDNIIRGGNLTDKPEDIGLEPVIQIVEGRLRARQDIQNVDEGRALMTGNTPRNAENIYDEQIKLDPETLQSIDAEQAWLFEDRLTTVEPVISQRQNLSIPPHEEEVYHIAFENDSGQREVIGYISYEDYGKTIYFEWAPSPSLIYNDPSTFDNYEMAIRERMRSARSPLTSALQEQKIAAEEKIITLNNQLEELYETYDLDPNNSEPEELAQYGLDQDAADLEFAIQDANDELADLGAFTGQYTDSEDIPITMRERQPGIGYEDYDFQEGIGARTTEEEYLRAAELEDAATMEISPQGELRTALPTQQTLSHSVVRNILKFTNDLANANPTFPMRATARVDEGVTRLPRGRLLTLVTERLGFDVASKLRDFLAEWPRMMPIASAEMTEQGQTSIGVRTFINDPRQGLTEFEKRHLENTVVELEQKILRQNTRWAEVAGFTALKRTISDVVEQQQRLARPPSEKETEITLRIGPKALEYLQGHSLADAVYGFDLENPADIDEILTAVEYYVDDVVKEAFPGMQIDIQFSQLVTETGAKAVMRVKGNVPIEEHERFIDFMVKLADDDLKQDSIIISTPVSRGEAAQLMEDIVRSEQEIGPVLEGSPAEEIAARQWPSGRFEGPPAVRYGLIPGTEGSTNEFIEPYAILKFGGQLEEADQEFILKLAELEGIGSVEFDVGWEAGDRVLLHAVTTDMSVDANMALTRFRLAIGRFIDATSNLTGLLDRSIEVGTSRTRVYSRTGKGGRGSFKDAKRNYQARTNDPDARYYNLNEAQAATQSRRGLRAWLAGGGQLPAGGAPADKGRNLSSRLTWLFNPFVKLSRQYNILSRVHDSYANVQQLAKFLKSELGEESYVAQYGDISMMALNAPHAAMAGQARYKAFWQDLRRVAPTADLEDMERYIKLLRVFNNLNTKGGQFRENVQVEGKYIVVTNPKTGEKVRRSYNIALLGETPIPVETAETAAVLLQRLRRKVGPEKAAELHAASQLLLKVYTDERQRLMRNGWFSRELVQQWEKEHPYYSPFDFVDFAETQGFKGKQVSWNQIRGRAFFDLKSGGQERVIANPIQSTLLAQLVRNEIKVRGNELVKSIVRGQEAVDRLTNNTHDPVRRLWYRDINGNRVTNKRAKAGEQTLTFWEDGELNKVVAPKWMVQELTVLNNGGFKDLSFWNPMKYAGMWSSVYRKATTRFTPAVVGRLFLVDTLTALLKRHVNPTEIWFGQGWRKAKTAINRTAARSQFAEFFGVEETDYEIEDMAVEVLQAMGGGRQGRYHGVDMQVETLDRAWTPREQQQMVNFMRANGVKDIPNVLPPNALKRHLRKLTRATIERAWNSKYNKVITNSRPVKFGAKATAKALWATPRFADWAEQAPRKAFVRGQLNQMLPGWQKQARQAAKEGRFREWAEEIAATTQMRQIAQDAAQLTLLFSRGSTFAKQINQWIPFFNSFVEGAKDPYRSLFSNPRGKSQAWGSLGVLSAGMMLLSIQNIMNPTYMMVSDDIKFGGGIYFLGPVDYDDVDIRTGQPKAVVHQIVPSLYGFSLFTATIQKFMHNLYMNNRELFLELAGHLDEVNIGTITENPLQGMSHVKEIAESVGGIAREIPGEIVGGGLDPALQGVRSADILPFGSGQGGPLNMLPAYVAAPWQMAENKDWFTGRPITPKEFESNDPSVGDRTPQTSRGVGNVTQWLRNGIAWAGGNGIAESISPAMASFAVREFGGAFVGEVTGTIDLIIDLIWGEAYPEVKDHVDKLMNMPEVYGQDAQNKQRNYLNSITKQSDKELVYLAFKRAQSNEWEDEPWIGKFNQQIFGQQQDFGWYEAGLAAAEKATGMSGNDTTEAGRELAILKEVELEKVRKIADDFDKNITTPQQARERLRDAKGETQQARFKLKEDNKYPKAIQFTDDADLKAAWYLNRETLGGTHEDTRTLAQIGMSRILAIPVEQEASASGEDNPAFIRFYRQRANEWELMKKQNPEMFTAARDAFDASMTPFERKLTRDNYELAEYWEAGLDEFIENQKRRYPTLAAEVEDFYFSSKDRRLTLTSPSTNTAAYGATPEFYTRLERDLEGSKSDGVIAAARRIVRRNTPTIRELLMYWGHWDEVDTRGTGPRGFVLAGSGRY